MNWLVLILLAPLIIVPAVLLCGFAGCGLDVVGTAPLPVAQIPNDLKATAVSQTEIDLEWNDLSGGIATYTIFRGASDMTPDKIADGTKADPANAHMEYKDKGLPPGTTFFYRAQTVLAGNVSAKSNPAASATTFAEPSPPPPPPPAWRTAYPVTPLLLTQTGGNFAKATVVQRISSALLNPAAAGTKVRITVQNSANGNLNLDKTTISQAAVTGDPFDSAPAPAPFAKLSYGAGNTPDVVIATQSQALSEPADFAFDPTKDLIVAFKIGTTGTGSRRPAVVGANFFSKNNIDEAEIPNRTAPYASQVDIVYFIEKIEVM